MMRPSGLGFLALALLAGPVVAQTPTITQIAAAQHILVLLSDGTVVALGTNEAGQLGYPKVPGGRFLPPVRVALPKKAVQVAISNDGAWVGTSYALLEDGTVWAWGLGRNNQLGVSIRPANERHTPGQVPGLAGVARITVSDHAGMAVLKDGTVRAWGELPTIFTGGNRVYPGVTTPIVIPGLSNVVDIVGHPLGGYALTRDGRVYAWGRNLRGELGTGTTSTEPELPVLVPGVKDVVSIATTFGAAVVVTRDGKIWSWGDNDQGGLGHGTDGGSGERSQPTPAPATAITDAVEVKAGTAGRQFIVRRRNGTLVGWGNSDWGQLGAGISGRFQLEPTPIRLPDVETLWLGGNFAFARTKDGTVWFWGDQAAARPLVGAKGNQRVSAKVPLEKLIP